MQLAVAADMAPTMRLSGSFLKPAPKKHTLQLALLASVVIHLTAILWIQIDTPDAEVQVVAPSTEVTLIEAPSSAAREPQTALEPQPVSEPEPVTAPIPEARAPAEKSPPVPKLQEPVVPATESIATESTEPIDWIAVTADYIKETSINEIKEERHRAAMWRKTHSSMFKPPEEWIVEEEPFLSDLQFIADKPKRLGIKISDNCYLGYPGVDPQTIDTDAPGWNRGGLPQPALKLISCGFGN